MRIRTIAALVVAVMAVGLAALPAAANDVGFGRDLRATVGKTGSIDQGCTTIPTGGGLGYPVISENQKNAYWRIQGAVTSLVSGAPVVGKGGSSVPRAGILTACGKVGPTLDQLAGGVGAYCGISKGVGHGQVIFGGPPNVYLSDLVWKASAGSLFVVYADASSAKGGPQDATLLALVSARGVAEQCLAKTTVGKNSTTEFVVDFVYALANEDTPHPNTLPGLCKDASCPLFGGKKRT